MENEIELDDTSFVLNQGLIRIDPEYRCVSILLNHFSFTIISITVDGLSEHFKVYKSEMSIQGEIKDYCFLYHSVLPTLAILSVLFISSFHFLLLGEYSYMGRNPPSLYS